MIKGVLALILCTLLLSSCVTASVQSPSWATETKSYVQEKSYYVVTSDQKQYKAKSEAMDELANWVYGLVKKALNDYGTEAKVSPSFLFDSTERLAQQVSEASINHAYLETVSYDQQYWVKASVSLSVIKEQLALQVGLIGIDEQNASELIENINTAIELLFS